jgi:hypothetical protein
MSNVVESSVMKPQVLPPLSAGATSPMASAQIAQQQQIQQQMALIGKSGGSKRRMRGGAQQILVPSVQPGAPNSQQTAASLKALTQLSEQQAAQAEFDNQVKKGGYRRRLGLSKRKRSRKQRRRRKNKSRRNRK